jgi:single-stranded-DNA-specific exonuclease
LEAAAPVFTPPRPASSHVTSATGGRKRWRLRSSPFRGRLEHSGLPKLIAHILENRGIGSLADAKRFLGGEATKLGDAFGLPGFEGAIGLLRDALKTGRLVCVYGDFDVDGISSTAILTETLRDLGGKVLPYIPNREREGYGLNLRAVDSLADRGVELLVTCDCGTSSLTEVEHARALGVEVVVIDHHLPPTALPDTSAMVNPKLPTGSYPFADYATAGLAYRLSEALYASERRDFPASRYVEMAALGTVADMVPLAGENRELVKLGLAALAQTQRPGLRALMTVSGIKPNDVSSEAIGFNLGPRINAAGRLADAGLALELLLTDEEGTAMALAESIDGLNRERQRLTREAEEAARAMVESRPEASLMVVGDSGFHQGIIGLVASRLVEQYGRPAVVYQTGEGESRGSCRSIFEYDITGGLRSCGELFERYGGHRQAGGFTIRNDRLAVLEERLTDHASRLLDGVDLTPSLEIDAEWPLSAVRTQEIQWLRKLQPHGQGNPDVLLLSRDVTVLEAKTVGDEGRHLRLKLRNGPVVWPAIAFRWDGDAPLDGSRIDVVYSLSADRYGPGEAGGALQLTVVDFVQTS